MAAPLTVALAVALTAVVLYCLARSFVPALRPADHHRDLDGWHVALGAAMIAMLLAPVAEGVSLAGMVVAAAALGWASVQLVRRAERSAYLRLVVGAGAMVAMVLLPSTPATAATTMHGHSGGTAGAAGLAPLLLVLLLMGVVAGRMLDAARRAVPVPDRLDACCDVAMAGAMGYLLLLMI